VIQRTTVYLTRSSAVARIVNLTIPRARADSGSQFVTRDPRDPSFSWPALPVTHDPVLDHGMSRSRLLTNHDEFTTIAFSSLQLYAIWNSGYGLCSEYLYSIYSKSSSLHYIHVDLRQFLQAEHGEQFLVFLI